LQQGVEDSVKEDMNEVDKIVEEEIKQNKNNSKEVVKPVITPVINTEEVVIPVTTPVINTQVQEKKTKEKIEEAIIPEIKKEVTKPEPKIIK
jgi:precorrin-2 methylase